VTLLDPYTGKKKMIKHYNAFLNKWNRVKDNIGDGAFGKVFMCEPKTEFKFDPECKGSNKHTLLGYDSFTIRKIPIPRSKNGDIRGTLIGNEITVKEKFIHPHLIEKVCIYKNQKNFYVLQEHRIGGNLLSQVPYNLKNFSEVRTSLIVMQLICALKHLHDQSVVHRDFKT
jgi:serine/threonine protein kinase